MPRWPSSYANPRRPRTAAGRERGLNDYRGRRERAEYIEAEKGPDVEPLSVRDRDASRSARCSAIGGLAFCVTHLQRPTETKIKNREAMSAPTSPSSRHRVRSTRIHPNARWAAFGPAGAEHGSRALEASLRISDPIVDS